MILGAMSLAWGSVLRFVPDGLGESLIGRNWAPSLQVLPPLTLAIAAFGYSQGAATGLRILAAAARGLHARILTAAFTIVGTLSGAAFGGDVGAAWGMGAAYLAGAFVWQHEFRQEARMRTSTSSGPTAIL